jgi:hypothetical protein
MHQAQLLHNPRYHPSAEAQDAVSIPKALFSAPALGRGVYRLALARVCT